MKKFFYLLTLLLSFSFAAQAQSSTLANFNLHQENVLRVGMLILGGWAILNILLSSFKLTNTTRARRYFFQMNLYWNVVNLLIAGAALHTIFSDDAVTRTLAESVRLHSWNKTILYLNIGLDFGYIMSGVYLKERSKNSAKSEQLFGWGQAIVLQGFFLLLLDVVLVILLEYNADQLFGLIPKT
ncbi:DUF6992 family protein [Pontibacter locisalis]|uniref:DUF6992 family protein n=1 Tax=Pontibacter locisalis TaxID=1719035 RepID=A0ABW5IHE8_9BACT